MLRVELTGPSQQAALQRLAARRLEAHPRRLLARPAALPGQELPPQHHHLWLTYHRLAVPFPWEVYRNLLREGQFHDLRDGKWRYQHGPKRPLSRRSASPLRRDRAPAGHLKASLQ